MAASDQRRFWLLWLAFVACALLIFLLAWPPKVDAESPDLAQIANAISEQGLSWKPVDYDRSFSLGALLRPEDKQRPEPPSVPSLQQLPLALDWRNNDGNWISPIKDQGRCGSCWAFAGVGAMEAMFAIANDTPGTFLDLSEQIATSCATTDGCSGWYMDDTAAYFRSTGTYYEWCFPYRATQNDCQDACADWQQNAFKTSGYTYVSRNVDSLKQALQYGPVQVAFLVYEDFDAYGSGVYEYAWGSQSGGHAVLLIGYVDTPGQYGGGYFICKNSWDTDWGLDGFFHIGYSQVTSVVKFGSDAYRYQMAGGTPDPTPTPTTGPSPTPTATPGPVGDDYEPDDSPEEASAIVPGAAQNHSIDPLGDEDWAILQLSSSVDITIETAGVAGGDTELWLYDTGLVELGYSDDIDYIGGNRYSRITTTLAPGSYYLRVAAYADNSTIALYTLSVSTAGTPTATPTPDPGSGDDWEPDGTWDTASVLVPEEPQTHSLAPSGDIDWFTFTLAVESEVILDTDGVSGGDTELWLYDSSLDQIGYDDDSGPDAYSRWEGTLPAGEYYVKFSVYWWWPSATLSLYTIELTAPQTVQISLPLMERWNLISLPMQPVDPAPATVLESIAGAYDLVQSYDADLGLKLIYDPQNPGGATLTAIDANSAFWIMMNQAATLQTYGACPATTAQNLYAGWNLVAYPCADTRPIGEVLASIEGHYTIVYAYVAGDADPWRRYGVDVPVWANSLTECAAGQAFWVYVTSDCTLSLSY